MERNNSKLLRDLIEKSANILIVSHAGPDPDAISSLVFTLQILRKNYPNKKVVGNIEGAQLDNFKLLFDTNLIGTKGFKEILKDVKPDLLLVLDMGELKLISRHEIQPELDEQYKTGSIVLIDHHLEMPQSSLYLLFNFNDNSCAETVYKLLLNELKLKTYEGYANHILLGIVGDTGSFRYMKESSDIQSTFKITYSLLKAGGNIDEVRTYLERISEKQLQVHQEYINNLKTTKEYSYTYISDRFFEKHSEITDSEYSTANKQFVQMYLKNIETAFWGFSIKPLGKGRYTLSFRASDGKLDLTTFTRQFSGGGHKSSAGGAISAPNIEDAIKQVIEVIEKYKEEAYANK